MAKKNIHPISRSCDWERYQDYAIVSETMEGQAVDCVIAVGPSTTYDLRANQIYKDMFDEYIGIDSMKSKDEQNKALLSWLRSYGFPVQVNRPRSGSAGSKAPRMFLADMKSAIRSTAFMEKLRRLSSTQRRDRVWVNTTLSRLLVKDDQENANAISGLSSRFVEEQLQITSASAIERTRFQQAKKKAMQDWCESKTWLYFKNPTDDLTVGNFEPDGSYADPATIFEWRDLSPTDLCIIYERKNLTGDDATVRAAQDFIRAVLARTLTGISPSMEVVGVDDIGDEVFTPTLEISSPWQAMNHHLYTNMLNRRLRYKRCEYCFALMEIKSTKRTYCNDSCRQNNHRKEGAK